MDFGVVPTVMLLAVGALLGGLFGWALLRSRALVHRERVRQLEADLDEAEGFQRENRDLRVENAELRKEREADAEKMQWVRSAEDKLRDAFKALAASALESNTTQFLEQSRTQIDGLLRQVKGDWGTQKAELEKLVGPLEKTLEQLDGQVREMESKREGAYQGLLQQVAHLSEAHRQLQDATSNLSQALRSSAQVRGRWGELQLRRIAEMAGMVSHVDFEEQAAGEQGRPDMVVHLPNGGILPVDAKAPMDAYLDAAEQDDDKVAARKLDEHARAVRGHMRSLSQKSYWSQFDRTPDFVVMVVPYESGLAAAFRADGTLLEDALDNKVLIVSPVTLFALMKAVAYGWLQWRLSDSAKKIAQEGQVVYERLRVLAEHLGAVGKRLDSTVDAYNAAVGSLESRVFPAAQRLKEMGAGSEDLPEPSTIETRPRALQHAATEDTEE